MDEPLSTSRGATHRKDCRDHRRDREERAHDKERDRRSRGRVGRMAKTQARRLGATGQGAETDPETRKQVEAAIKKLEQEREDALNQKKKAVEDQNKLADDYAQVKAELARIKASQTQEAAPPPPPPPPKKDDELAALLLPMQQQIVALTQQQQQQQVSLMPAPPERVRVGDLSFDPSFLNRSIDVGAWEDLRTVTHRRANLQAKATISNMAGLANAALGFKKEMRAIYTDNAQHKLQFDQMLRVQDESLYDGLSHGHGGGDPDHGGGGDHGPGGGDPGGGGGFPSGGCQPFGSANNNQGHFTPVVYQIRN